MWVAQGDFNKDGKLDLVVANESDSTVGVLFGSGKGTFRPQKTHHVTSPSYVGVADFNGDGNLDLLTIAYDFNSMGILFGSSKGSFGTQVNTLFEGTSWVLRIGDRRFQSRWKAGCRDWL